MIMLRVGIITADALWRARLLGRFFTRTFLDDILDVFIFHTHMPKKQCFNFEMKEFKTLED